MANNYTQFAEMIEMPAEAAKYAAMLDVLLSEMGDGEPDISDQDTRMVEDAQAIFADRGEWYGTSTDFDYGNKDRLYITASEAGDLEAVVAILAATMRRFDLIEPICIQWADTCSKMRAGEFGGGAVVITKDEQFWMPTGKFIGNTTEAIATERRLDAGFESA